MIAKVLTSLLMAVSFSFAPVTVHAQADPVSPFQPCESLDPAIVDDSEVCKAAQGNSRLFGPGSLWNNILNVITYVIGAIAILMILIGALRYALSGGDAGSTTGAKNTIIYAVVALIVAAMANAIVNFVLTNL